MLWLAVIFCSFISHLIGHETINIPEIFSGVHGFTGMTVTWSEFCGPVMLKFLMLAVLKIFVPHRGGNEL